MFQNYHMKYLINFIKCFIHWFIFVKNWHVLFLCILSSFHIGIKMKEDKYLKILRWLSQLFLISNNLDWNSLLGIDNERPCFLFNCFRRWPVTHQSRGLLYSQSRLKLYKYYDWKEFINLVYNNRTFGVWLKRATRSLAAYKTSRGGYLFDIQRKFIRYKLRFL